MEEKIERETDMKNKRDVAISFSNQRVANNHDRVSLRILYLMISSNKAFKSLKCC